MNLKEIFASLKECLKSNKNNYIEENSWCGDTESGFYTETHFDIDALYAEIDEFSAQFAEYSISAQDEVLTDERIVEVLHSLGVDTGPSKYGFTELQVSATNVPTIRKIIERCMAAAAPSPAVAVEPVAQMICPACGKNRFKETCPSDGHCQMIADAHCAAPSPSLAVRDVVDAARYRLIKSKIGMYAGWWQVQIPATIRAPMEDLEAYFESDIDAAMREKP